MSLHPELSNLFSTNRYGVNTLIGLIKLSRTKIMERAELSLSATPEALQLYNIPEFSESWRNTIRFLLWRSRNYCRVTFTGKTDRETLDKLHPWENNMLPFGEEQGIIESEDTPFILPSLLGTPSVVNPICELLERNYIDLLLERAQKRWLRPSQIIIFLSQPPIETDISKLEMFLYQIRSDIHSYRLPRIKIGIIGKYEAIEILKDIEAKRDWNIYSSQSYKKRDDRIFNEIDHPNQFFRTVPINCAQDFASAVIEITHALQYPKRQFEIFATVRGKSTQLFYDVNSSRIMCTIPDGTTTVAFHTSGHSTYIYSVKELEEGVYRRY